MATQTQEEPTSARQGADGGRHLAPSPPRQAGVDRFDEAIVVTRTRAWIGLAACLALVAGVVVWATTTTVDRTVKARGIALVNGTLTRVLSPVTGTITELTVALGDRVESEQVIGRVQSDDGRTVPLVAPIGAQVLDLPAGVGVTLDQDELVASLTATDGPLVIEVFVPPGDAQQVENGTRARLSFPQGGTIDGEVSHVDQVPLTTEQVADAIGSASLASIVASGDGLVRISVTPSSDGDRVDFDSADVVDVTLILGSQHPIDYVF